ncbi:ATP-binding cassette domain-containing protein [Virgibacillus dakarensis]|uniref:ABC transporter ATP-binding protein n=1 Tax=Lentibacillus populi TaxID=1827502 RepID=A0A9W5X7J1_9BACI|nr:ABC transporter ATP-binding protein [Lentibacillus populi]MTW87154.1 ATP-binding cassette domain-containing protein [Virgibacillus dakarensis]GGB60866.1 ABC transporter ATP-binding protein [Lentibacillus populi]
MEVLIINCNEERVLSLKNVTIHFDGKQVLDGINLDVYQGQIIGYIGPNGAGKSTTLKIILGLVDGYDGEVEIFGRNIAAGNHTYKRKIGYVAENAEIYDNLTACEYLTFIGELYGIDRVLAEDKALKLMRAFEMDDVFHTRISSFSKGMRQKVLIISSLLHDPDLIFLDEPLSGLDANSVMIIKDILEQLASRGKTIFYSSHIMDVVEKISNRIVLLIDGKIAADGTFEELREQSKQGSLEGIFNQLTGFDEHQHTAEKFVDIVMDGEEK